MTMTILFSWYWWIILAKSKLLLWSFLSPAPSPLPSMASLGSDSLMKYLYKLQSISNDLWEILEYSAITKWRSSAVTVRRRSQHHHASPPPTSAVLQWRKLTCVKIFRQEKFSEEQSREVFQQNDYTKKCFLFFYKVVCQRPERFVT